MLCCSELLLAAHGKLGAKGPYFTKLSHCDHCVFNKVLGPEEEGEGVLYILLSDHLVATVTEVEEEEEEEEGGIAPSEQHVSYEVTADLGSKTPGSAVVRARERIINDETSP
eukprot:1158064-Pelagomonas_calceolata.AAC.4